MMASTRRPGNAGDLTTFPICPRGRGNRERRFGRGWRRRRLPLPPFSSGRIGSRGFPTPTSAKTWTGTLEVPGEGTVLSPPGHRRRIVSWKAVPPTPRFLVAIPRLGSVGKLPRKKTHTIFHDGLIHSMSIFLAASSRQSLIPTIRFGSPQTHHQNGKWTPIPLSLREQDHAVSRNVWRPYMPDVPLHAS